MSDTSVPAGTFTLDAPENPNAEEFPSYYDICDRSGFRVKAGKLLEEWTGLAVKPEFYDSRHPQEFVRGRAERVVEQLSPEPEEEFLSVNQVSSESL
jgi:hypothetical protein